MSEESETVQRTGDKDDHPALEGYPIDTDYLTRKKHRDHYGDTSVGSYTEDSPEAQMDFEGAEASSKSVESRVRGEDRLIEETSSVASQRRTVDETYRFQYTTGNGGADQLDDIIDQNAVLENDGRSNTRTMFYPTEGTESSRVNQYKRLAKLNDGMYSPDRKQQNAWADKRRWTDSFCSTVGMTEGPRERVFTILENLNMKHMGPYSTEKVILAIMTVVSRENRRMLRDEESFHDLLDSIGTDLKEVRRVRRLVIEKSELLSNG